MNQLPGQNRPPALPGATDQDYGRKPPRRRLPDWWLLFVFQLAIGLIVLGAGCYLAFSLGVSQGKTEGNAERDAFYRERANLTPAAGGSSIIPGGTGVTSVAGTPVSGSATAPGNNVFARIDKIEGSKITLLVLDAAGSPTGTSVTLQLGATTEVSRGSPAQPTDLQPGDNVVFIGSRSGPTGDYNAQKIVIVTGNP